MKKVVSILFTAVFLVSGIHFTIARHFCNERLAKVVVSLSGEKASCGMDENNSPRTGHQVFNNHCCEDHLVSFVLTALYYPESFNLNQPTPEVHALIFQEYAIWPALPENSNLPNTVFPPGELAKLRLTPPFTCVFRT